MDHHSVRADTGSGGGRTLGHRHPGRRGGQVLRHRGGRPSAGRHPLRHAWFPEVSCGSRSVSRGTEVSASGSGLHFLRRHFHIRRVAGAAVPYPGNTAGPAAGPAWGSGIRSGRRALIPGRSRVRPGMSDPLTTMPMGPVSVLGRRRARWRGDGTSQGRGEIGRACAAPRWGNGAEVDGGEERSG